MPDRQSFRPLVLGIDATNIRGGGGVTHLRELLRSWSPEDSGIARIVVWTSHATEAQLPQRAGVEYRSSRGINGSLPIRAWWQRWRLGRCAREAGCDVLFVPGGTYLGSFRPFVAMSQNMLPFELREALRYGFHPITAKLLLLRIAQARSFRRASAVLFISEYARRSVSRTLGLARRMTVVPHGVSEAFRRPPRPQRALSECTAGAPMRLLYVSFLGSYKHQDSVVRAVCALRAAGRPVQLDLVGSGARAEVRRLQRIVDASGLPADVVRFVGAVPHAELPEYCERAEVGVFASSCENLPITLLEMMAAGLPIASSRRGPMPEVLGGDAVFFEPTDSDEIRRALETLIDSRLLRERLAAASVKAAAAYRWRDCANATMRFLADTAVEGSDVT